MTEMYVLWAMYWLAVAFFVIIVVAGVVMCVFDIRESWK